MLRRTGAMVAIVAVLTAGTGGPPPRLCLFPGIPIICPADPPSPPPPGPAPTVTTPTTSPPVIAELDPPPSESPTPVTLPATR